MQGTPGRQLSVQLGSATSAQPAVELQAQANDVQGAMLEPSVANKNWVCQSTVGSIVLQDSSHHTVAGPCMMKQTTPICACLHVFLQLLALVYAQSVDCKVQGAPILRHTWFSQVRLTAVCAAVFVAARFSPSYLSNRALGFVHLLAFGTFLGTNIWTTFVAGLTMFKNLPRQVRGKDTDLHAVSCTMSVCYFA